jgi:hypothetical protein
MARKTAAIDDAISTTNAVTTRAASAALRKTGSLANAAPLGRAFSSIATLCDLTERIESHLVAGHAALLDGAESGAAMEFTRASALAGGTIIEALPDLREREPAPPYLIKRR